MVKFINTNMAVTPLILAGLAQSNTPTPRANTLTTLFSECLQTDLESTVLSLNTNYDLWCWDKDGLYDDTDAKDPDDREVLTKCELYCSTGYRIDDNGRATSELPEYGQYTCRKISDSYDMHFWRYRAFSHLWDGKKHSAPEITTEDSDGCVQSNCFIPRSLYRRRFWRYPDGGALATSASENLGLERMWQQKWVTNDFWATQIIGDHSDGGTVNANSNEETNFETPYSHAKIYLYKDPIQQYFPNADFAANGYTVIVTFKHEMAGTFFVGSGANWNSARDGSTAGYTKTISFTSTWFNRAKLGEAKDDTVGFAHNNNRVSFDIYLYADAGVDLPAGQKIMKVQLLEGEFSNTECLVHESDYPGFTKIAAAGGEVDYDYSAADQEGSAFAGKTGVYNMNPITKCTFRNNY